MAKEIKSAVSLTISQGGSSAKGSASIAEDLGSGGSVGFTATIGSSSASAIDFGALTTPKVIFIQNLDPDNSLVVDKASALNSWPQTIMPGGAVLLRPAAATIFAKANVAPVNAWIVAG